VVNDGAARIKLGLAKELKLGNLDAQRDWGYARRLRGLRCCHFACGNQRRVFNIGSGTPRRIGDILNTLIGLT
jgi:GDP-D-mannose dehydratase